MMITVAVLLGIAVVLRPVWALGTCALLTVATLTPLTWLYRGLILTTFASGILIPVAGVDLRLEHALLGMLLLAMILRTPRITVRKESRAIIALLFAFIMWNALVTVFQSPDLTRSFTILAWLSLDIVLFSVCASLATRYDGHRALVYGVVGAGTVGLLSLIMWVLAANGHTGWGVQYDYVSGSFVPKLFAFESNLLGSTLALWSVIGIGLIEEGHLRTVRMRAFIWGAVALSIIGTVSTLSRAAVAGLGVGLAAWAVMSRRFRWREFLAVLGILGVIFVGITWAPVNVPYAGNQIESKARDFINFQESTGYVRVAAWDDALDDLSEKNAYTTGLGVNTFGKRHSWITETGPGYISNLFLQVIYDGGIPAGLILGLLLLVVWGPIRSHNSTHGRTRRAWLVVFLVSSMATSAFWLGSTWATLGLLIGNGGISKISPEARQT